MIVNQITLLKIVQCDYFSMSAGPGQHSSITAIIKMAFLDCILQTSVCELPEYVFISLFISVLIGEDSASLFLSMYLSVQQPSEKKISKLSY